jgi:hypothetical protein
LSWGLGVFGVLGGVGLGRLWRLDGHRSWAAFCLVRLLRLGRRRSCSSLESLASWGVRRSWAFLGSWASSVVGVFGFLRLLGGRQSCESSAASCGVGLGRLVLGVFGVFSVLGPLYCASWVLGVNLGSLSRLGRRRSRASLAF